jgi:hypothetical protein
VKRQGKAAHRDSLDLVELRVHLIAHCRSLKAVIDLWDRGEMEGAKARLEGAVAALEAVQRAQVADVQFQCPECLAIATVLEWVDNESRCLACGHVVEALP